MTLLGFEGSATPPEIEYMGLFDCGRAVETNANSQKITRNLSFNNISPQYRLMNDMQNGYRVQAENGVSTTFSLFSQCGKPVIKQEETQTVPV